MLVWAKTPCADAFRSPISVIGSIPSTAFASQIPLTDLNSVTCPGTAAGWCKTIETFGSGKLSMAEILAPAIRMAKEGVAVHELNAEAWKKQEKLIKNASPAWKE